MTNTACTLFWYGQSQFSLLKYPTLQKQKIACQTLSGGWWELLPWVLNTGLRGQSKVQRASHLDHVFQATLTAHCPRDGSPVFPLALPLLSSSFPPIWLQHLLSELWTIVQSWHFPLCIIPHIFTEWCLVTIRAQHSPVPMVPPHTLPAIAPTSPPR